MPKVGFHGHVEEAYLRHVEKKLKEKRAAMGINPLIRDIYIKIESREAKSGAPLSPALSPYGINVSDFVNQFNKQTEQSSYGAGVKIPTVISVFENKTTKFFLTTIYSYYIFSNNNNKYKALRLKDVYKKFKMIKESLRFGSRRKWSNIHELYSKTELKRIKLFTQSRRKKNQKKYKNFIKKHKIQSENEGKKDKNSEDIELYKCLLSTIKGNRIIVYLKFKQMLKGGVFLPKLNTIKNHEYFIDTYNDILLGAYGLKKSLYKNRSLKLKFKNMERLTRWLIHREFFFFLIKTKECKANVKCKSTI